MNYLKIDFILLLILLANTLKQKSPGALTFQGVK